jgi:nitrite reductase/ring-hydroxylating ferredoxin subunit/uncharacterized membrane protein
MSTIVQELKETLRQQTWIDRMAIPVQKAVRAFYENTGPVGQKIANFLHGTWLGHPLHPVITDVPVGAWTAAVALDVMAAKNRSRGLQRGADAAVAIGVASAVGAAVTGITDWQHLQGESRRTGFLHATLNTVALTLFVGSMVSRGKRNYGLGRDLALSGYLIAAASAYLGGDLVFRQKIGVNHAPEKVETPDFEPVMDAAGLPENRLVRAMLKDTPLVLVKQGDQVFALAESCAHLGGPLADGELGVDAHGRATVTCPWHSSRFEMHSGVVLDGPSAYPQPCFETRVRNGQIEVRQRSQAEEST